MPDFELLGPLLSTCPADDFANRGQFSRPHLVPIQTKQPRHLKRSAARTIPQLFDELASLAF